MKDILSVEGKLALVTGAGQGVGQQIAEHLSAHGATVVINDYFLERAESAAKAINDAGGKAIALQADVTKYDEVKAMVQKIRELAGPVDILVNNAGNLGAIPSPEGRVPFWEVSPEVWQGAIDVNLYGVIHCTSAVLPDMIERKSGRLITIISDAGRVGETGLEVYSGAKAGAAGFMRAVARAMGRNHITANCVSISATFTDEIEAQVRAAAPEYLKKVMEKYVIRRPGKPTDVANMVLFLASGASDWITGQTYPVNGGFSFGL